MIHVTEADVARAWPVPDDSADKYSRGAVGIDTGSVKFPGAGVLSVLGAAYSGAGFIRYIGPDEVKSTLLTMVPSVTFGPGRVNAWLVGSGWDDSPSWNAHMAAACKDAVPMVVDAGAQTLLSERLPEGSLLTPHAGELARLMGVSRVEVEKRPAEYALEAAQLWKVSVLVKGHVQYVARPDGEIGVAITGPAWTAQAGSGDVLAGIAATLLASGIDAFRAGLMAASVQAIAASRHVGPYPPHELARFLPEVIGSLSQGDD